MLAIRALLARRYLAGLICASALLLRVLVPAGFMIGGQHGRVSIELCPGVAAGHEGMGGHGKSHDGGKAELPCAFSGLAAAALGGADPIQIAALIAFVLAIALDAAVLPAIWRFQHLRPPLRGPPALS